MFVMILILPNTYTHGSQNSQNIPHPFFERVPAVHTEGRKERPHPGRAGYRDLLADGL